LIAVDWGTSNFRAYRLNSEGAIQARRSSPQGILRVPSGNFEQALRAEIGDWLTAGETHVLLCGMIGSRQGWVEAQYLPCPAGIDDLATSLLPVPFPGAQVWLVPGVMGSDDAGVPEVMRGEETAAMGILGDCGGEALVCFPGTHSKWLKLSDGRVNSFTTFMTGEIYSAVRNGTILGRMMTQAASVAGTAFLDGVARAVQPGGLLHHLFGVRTLGLMGQLGEEDAASYLSGLLIGHEVRSAMRGQAIVHLVGTSALCGLYAQAIHACGGEAKIENEDAAALGMAAIGRRVHWN
jgi:2-dehydro-3-deoxygalactonokinase